MEIHSAYSTRFRITTLVIGITFAVAHGADEHTSPADRVDRVLKDLASPDFQIRLRGEAELNELPLETIDLLKKASESSDVSLDVKERLIHRIGEMKRTVVGAEAVKANLASQIALAERLTAAYVERGHRGRWDDDVRQGIRCQILVPPSGRNRPSLRQAAAKYRAAIESGCSDPFVKLMLAFSTRFTDLYGDEAAATLAGVPEAMIDRKYPEWVTVWAYALRADARWDAARKRPSDDDRSACVADLDAAAALLKATGPQAQSAIPNYIGFIESVSGTAARVKDRGGPEYIDELLRSARMPRDSEAAVAVRVKAFLAAYRVQPHDRRPSNRPDDKREDSPYAAPLMAALKEAEDPAFDKNANVLAARHSAAIALGQVEREAGLFDRIIRIEPWSRPTYFNRLLWLRDRYDNEALAKLATQMANSYEVDAGIPPMAAEAHWYIAQRLPEEQRAAYLATPDVWNQIESAFTAYLRRFSNDLAAHAHFAYYAYQAGHIEVAARHFELAGDAGADDPLNDSTTYYDYYRGLAAEAVKATGSTSTQPATKQ